MHPPFSDRLDMLFRDLVLISRISQKTRKSLRATSHVRETPRFIIYRHSGCTDFDDCADSTCWATAGKHRHNPSVLWLDNAYRRKSEKIGETGSEGVTLISRPSPVIAPVEHGLVSRHGIR
jgi:hypothetical protein